MNKLVFLFCLITSPVIAEDKKAISPSGNEVEGLKLPVAQEVSYDEGFITLQAQCKGPVEWMVLSTSIKVKFKINPATPNEIDVAIPPYESGITIFAVGLVDGKLTKFARTDITVRGPPAPNAPNSDNPPQPLPPDLVKPLHLTIIEDKRIAEMSAILTSNEFTNKLANGGVKFNLYKINDARVKQKKFDSVVERYGTPTIILQDNTGKALILGRMPTSLAEMMKLIAPYLGDN